MSSVLLYISVGCFTFLPETDINWAFLYSKLNLTFMSVCSFLSQAFLFNTFLYLSVKSDVGQSASSHFAISFPRLSLRVYFATCIGVIFVC